MKLNEAIEKYLNKCKSDGFNYDCLRAKTRHLREFLAYKNTDIENITIDDIYGFINSLNKSPSNLWTYKKNLKAFFKFTNLMQWTNIPIDLIRNKKTRQRVIKFISPEEHKLILSECNLKYYTLFSMLYESGTRIGELLSVRIQNIDHLSDPKKFYILTEKTNELRVCFFDTDISSYLSTRKGKQQLFDISQNAVRFELSRICKKLNIRNLSPHVYRHAFAKRTIDSNLNLRIIQELLGHKDISSTQIYTHVLSSELEEAHRKMNEKEILKICSTVGKKKRYRLDIKLTQK
jgi:integrase/recombinase XerD